MRTIGQRIWGEQEPDEVGLARWRSPQTSLHSAHASAWGYACRRKRVFRMVCCKFSLAALAVDGGAAELMKGH